MHNAYPVEIEKRKNGGKTEYYISIDNESDNETLSAEELNLLMGIPRIPEVVYRYSRYHYEATLEYLKQCDVKYGLKVMDTADMTEAIVQFEAQIPKDDTSSFSFDKRSKDAKEKLDSNSITLEMLYNRFDELQEKGLGDKTEEGMELRAMIRTYIEQEKLSVRVTRSTTNGELLDMFEDAVHGKGEDSSEPDPKPDPESEPEEESAPARRRR